MLIETSDNVVAQSGLSKNDILLEVVFSLYQRSAIPLGLAAQMAGLHRFAFQQEMGKRKISINLNWEDVQKDMTAIESAKS